MMTSRTILVLAGFACCFSAALQAQNVFIDTFDRTDSTDPGPDWSEIVGEWEIAGNLARPDQTDQATPERLLIHEPLPIEEGFHIDADVLWPAGVEQWNGIVWNLEGTSTFYLFRLHPDRDRAQVIKRVSGANNEIVVDTGDGAVAIKSDALYRMSVSGDGNGNFWWAVSDDGELLGSGAFSFENPLPAGPSGIYAGRESIGVDRFSVETFPALSTEIASVEIETAVEIVYDTSPGAFYRLESSSDLLDWIPLGNVVEGDGSKVSELFSIRDYNRRFFRASAITME